MAHEDKDNYAGKHTQVQIDNEVAEKLLAQADNNTITCAAVHKIASSLLRPAQSMGVQTDLAELKISHCQLGLFGYPEIGKNLNPDFVVGSDLEKTLTASCKNNRLSCKKAWEIAKNFKIKRLDVGSACQKLGIKIKPCQLGTF